MTVIVFDHKEVLLTLMAVFAGITIAGILMMINEKRNKQ